MGRVKGRDYPSVGRWRASRARKQILKRLKNKLGWMKMALPKDWDTWDEARQLQWAREILGEIAAGEDNGKVRALAASALARSLEPKGRPVAQQGAKVDAEGKQERSKAYLEALKAEIDAELEKRNSGEH